MAMSLQAYAQNAHIKTPTRVEPDRGGLDNTPASASDRDLLRAHLGREVLHGSVGRDFSKSYMRNADGTNSPRMYRFDTEAFEVSQVLFRLSRWENLEYAKKI